MSLPQAIKTMLQGATGVSSSNITYGTRNEFSTYPAVTFTITSNETVAIGSTPLKKCEVNIRSIAETAESAQTTAEAVEDELVEGTYNSILFDAIVKKNSVLEASPNGYGDETLPFVCITTAEIYYQ